MPGEYIKPKAYNRRWYIDIGTTAAPEWVEVARGITSRGNAISEQTTDYTDMAGRGVAEKETESISIVRNFSGFRVIGDEAQDAVFIARMYDLNNRTVPFMEFYDNMPTGKPNGHKGTAAIQITDDGSGNAAARETIGFGLGIVGLPETGTVTLGEDGAPSFTAAS